MLHLLLFGLHYLAHTCASNILFSYTNTLDKEASIRFALKYVMVVLQCWWENLEVQRCLHVVLTRRIRAKM